MGSKIKIIDTSGKRIQKKAKPNQVELTASSGELLINDAPISGGGGSSLPTGGVEGNLLMVDGSGDASWTGIIKSSNGSTSYDIDARAISDGLVGTSVDGLNRILADSSLNPSVDWHDRVLKTATGLKSLAWVSDSEIGLFGKYALPNATGATGQVLTNDGAGHLAWTTVSADSTPTINSFANDFTIGSYLYNDVDTTMKAINVTLPNASAFTQGTEFVITDKYGNANTNNITITTPLAALKGSTTFVMDKSYISIRIHSDGVYSWVFTA